MLAGARMHVSTLRLALGVCFAALPKGIFGEYYGKFIGDITTRAHSFSAKVYAFNDKKVRFTELVYDGTGPAAHFWVGKGKQGPSKESGEKTVDELGSSEVLKAYNNANIVITLPKKITDYDYIGIYCVQFNHNFGEVFLPPGFELPAEQKLGGLVGTQNGVKASEVTLKDSITIELKEFYYDGKGTDVHFTVGPTKDARKDQLTKLLDEQGRDTNLGAYSGKTVTMTLPKGHYWNDYQWFAVYSFQSSASFGGLEITKAKSESLPVHAPPDAPTPSKSGFPTVIAVGVGVGVAVCIATSAFVFWYRSPDKPEPAGAAVSPGVGATGQIATATGTDAA